MTADNLTFETWQIVHGIAYFAKGHIYWLSVFHTPTNLNYNYLNYLIPSRNTSYNKSLTSTTNTMHYFISVPSLFALILSATAVSGAPALDTTSVGEVPFTFTSWVEGMIANPNGNHLSPDEAVDAVYNTSSIQLGKRVWCDVEASHPRTNVRLLSVFK